MSAGRVDQLPAAADRAPTPCLPACLPVSACPPVVFICHSVVLGRTCVQPTTPAYHPIPFRPKTGPAEDGAAATSAADASEAGGERGLGLLPPCVLADRAKHGGLTYQLHYRVQPAAV